MLQRKICAVTGSRADYDLLTPVMKKIRQEPSFRLQVIATGMHLAPQFGLTYKSIEADGFTIDAKVDMELTGDTPSDVTRSLGRGVKGFAEALDRLQPDLLLVLGDRFEILAAAQSAMIAKIPMAHIAGGDTTEGSFDEAIRHSITKMSHIHFVTNEAAARRVRQLGEDPAHIYNFGSPGGIDAIKKELLDRAALERELGFTFRKRNLLVTFHPATLDAQPAGTQFRELLTALDRLGDEVGIIFTLPNADPEGNTISALIEEYTAARPRAKAFASLGQVRYLSCVAQMDAVVGNSSSGLYEVPSFRKPTVNIGDRQKGRLQASSVISCRPEASDIERAMREAFTKDCSDAVNPYDKGNSAQRIVAALKATPDYAKLLKKRFFDL
ncbi:MAG TPA: UDP-N-acetylglucosamine 2-epimerase [Nitrospirota bacterium]|nr:UDP-N-acetylglucosamine 2-epimerase [Nitrospirota bacterium]